jgi:hypothetical protein
MGDYAMPTVKGRSHATRHHYVAERFFGRTANRPRELRARLFGVCPWNLEGLSEVFCFECHVELLHNPAFTPADLQQFSALFRARNLDEPEKTSDRSKLAGRVWLLHQVIQAGLKSLGSAS